MSMRFEFAPDVNALYVRFNEGEVDRLQHTDVHGLFLAGDADGDVQFAIVAAAEGAKAGVAINLELQKELRL